MSIIQEFLRLYDPQDEELLTVYRQAAIEFAERYMNRGIGVSSVVAFSDGGKRIRLPFGDVKEIKSVETESGEPVAYRHNPVTDEIILSIDAPVLINFTVGWDTNEIPHPVKIGCLKVLATWYENREDISNGVSTQEIPFNHRAVFELYRLPAGA